MYCCAVQITKELTIVEMEEFKISYLNGCTYSMDVNNTEFVDLDKDTQKELCFKIFNNEDCSFLSMVAFIETYLEVELDENDDKKYKDMSYDDLKKLCVKYLNTEDCSEATMQEMVERFIENNGEYTDLGYCETCGSYNSRYDYVVK